MDWVHTLTIIGTYLGLFIYMLMRQDKFRELVAKTDVNISKSNERIALIEGYLFKQLELPKATRIKADPTPKRKPGRPKNK